jgi:flagellar FliJ protein
MTEALHTLLQHAEAQRDEAHAALLQAEDFARRMAAQTQQLETYREEYRLRHPAHGGQLASIELLRCHQGFMQRLDQALAQQRQAEAQAAARVAQQRERLAELQVRAASVGKLIERRGLEARQRAARAEQRLLDEAAMRRAQRGEHALARAWRSTTQAVPL